MPPINPNDDPRHKSDFSRPSRNFGDQTFCEQHAQELHTVKMRLDALEADRTLQTTQLNRIETDQKRVLRALIGDPEMKQPGLADDMASAKKDIACLKKERWMQRGIVSGISMSAVAIWEWAKWKLSGGKAGP